MKRLLVTGVSGLLGRNICRNPSFQDWEIFGTCFGHQASAPGITVLKKDLRDQKGIEFMMALQEVHGIIHIGGPDRISRYGLGKLMAEVFGEREAVLVPCRQRDVATSAPRPPDVSMDSRKPSNWDFAPLPCGIKSGTCSWSSRRCTRTGEQK